MVGRVMPDGLQLLIRLAVYSVSLFLFDLANKLFHSKKFMVEAYGSFQPVITPLPNAFLRSCAKRCTIRNYRFDAGVLVAACAVAWLRGRVRLTL